MRVLAVMALALAGCGSGASSPRVRCSDAFDRRAAPAELVAACRAIFRPACRDALADAHDGMRVDDGVAIVRTCMNAYDSIAPRVDAEYLRSELPDWTAESVRSTDEVDKLRLWALGDALAKVLLPVATSHP